MPLPTPRFDARSYRDLLDEAVARIPVHNPEWTNFNDADPGITLLQLFAFMAENVIYRANLIPERNRQKFLRLLGLPLRAADAARGFVAFANPRGPLAPLTLAADLELFAGKVPFRTGNALQLLPVERKLFFKAPLAAARRAEVETLYRRLYASVEAAGQALGFYETLPFPDPVSGAALPVLDLADTLDGALWLALLARRGDTPEAARQAIAGTVLTLGVLPALEVAGLALPPGGERAAPERPGLIFEIPNTASQEPRYERLDARLDDDLLTRPGLAELSLPSADRLRTWTDLDPLEPGLGDFPPPLEESDDGDRLITWIRVRSPEADPRGGRRRDGRQLRARLSWIGINAARVAQRARVTGEPLPAGTGEPDQSAVLANRPVIAGSVRLTVNGEVWQPVDDLAAAPPEAAGRDQAGIASPRVYTLDREAGEIRFGDGAHGARPPAGAVLSATYDHGGGRAGQVGLDAINKGPALPPGVKVTNPLPTWGGDEGESVEEGERRIPGFVKHRDRLVSAEDFADITRATPGVDLGRVEVLPLFHPDLPEAPADGVITVLVIPQSDREQPEAPRPDRLFLEAVCRHLEPRRLITSEVHVRGPVYRRVWVSIGLDVVPGREQGPVFERVQEAVRRFLSPLAGGFDGTGWPLGKAIEAAEVAAAATRVDGVAKVSRLLLAGETGAEVARLDLDRLELPRPMAAVVQAGDALPVAAIRGLTPEPEPAGGVPVVPVPVLPEEC